MPRTIADLMAETLNVAGVKRIYGVVGDSLNGFTDSLRRQKKIDWVHMRHEEAAAFAAGAEAHLTGELAVCAGSCGPGNLHLINGLFDCHRSRVPVLAIAAHIPSAEIGGVLLPGDASRAALRRVRALCRARLQPRPDAARPRKGDPNRHRPARRIGGGHPGRRRAARDRRQGGKLAGAQACSRAAGRRRRRRPGGAAERRRAHHHDVRRGLRRRPCRGRGPGGGAQRAHRPFAARQGIRRVRQPVRRRHDRLHRFHLGLCGDEELRHARPARYRLPLPAVLSRGRQDRADRHPAGEPRQPLPPGAGRRRRCRRHGGGAAAQAQEADGRQVPRWRARPLQEGARGPRQARRRQARRQDHPPAVCRPPFERSRGG